MEMLEARLLTEWERMKKEAAPMFSVNIVKPDRIAPVFELSGNVAGPFIFHTMAEVFAFLKGIALQKQLGGEEGPT